MSFRFFKTRNEINGWSRLTTSGFRELLEFLLPFEYSAVPFSSRLLDPEGIPVKSRLKSNIVLVEKINSGIVSAVLLSREGLIFPVLTKESGITPLSDLIYKSSFSNRKFITIMGESSSALRFEELFRHRHKCSIDYDLLAESAAQISEDIKNYLEKKERAFLNSFILKRADPADLKMLMPLRKSYELEEVLLDPSSFNEIACRQRFIRTIIDNAVFFAEKDGIPAATCCINSIGLKWAQIGGVFTVPELRSKGLSAALMRETASWALKNNKGLCLFVKKDNAPALKLYGNCGFKKRGGFRISYLERR